MNLAVRVLAQPGLSAGFGLAGMPAIDVASPGDAAARLAGMIDDPSIGVILIEESLHRALPDDLRRAVDRRALPMVVPFPGITAVAEPAAESYIIELLRQVIGYRVRLR